MDIRNRRAIHKAAADALANAPEAKKTVLIYALVCCGLSAVSAVFSHLFSTGIAETGGLASMQLRSILTTGQTLLPIVQVAVTSCLGLGYHGFMLNVARGNDVQPRALMDGFRYFGPLFRATLIQFLMYLAIGIASMYLSVSIFLVTPLASPLIEILEPFANSSTALDSQLVLDEAMILEASDAAQPLIWIYLAVFALLLIPVYFRFRMTTFALADEPRRGALAALSKSIRLLRRNGLALLKLDLTMWWYYLLLILSSLVCYGDMLLPLLGISLPWNSTVSYYLFFALSLIMQIGIYYLFMNRVNAVYAAAYDALHQPRQEQIKYPFPTQM